MIQDGHTSVAKVIRDRDEQRSTDEQTKAIEYGLHHHMAVMAVAVSRSARLVCWREQGSTSGSVSSEGFR